MWLFRAKGLIALVSPNLSERKGNNKVSKRKLKKYLFGKKNERKTGKFRYLMTIAKSPLVAYLIKMQDLHYSILTCLLLLMGGSAHAKLFYEWHETYPVVT